MQTCSSLLADSPAPAFYIDVLTRLEAAGVPFLIGGAFALTRYTSIHRDTKDLDVFTRPDDTPRALEVMAAAGYRTELTFPHWLGKIFGSECFIDIIFSSGNGVARVDDVWFENAPEAQLLGLDLKLCPPEEMIWSKAFIQERERFDGADVAHLLLTAGPSLDWHRLLARFGDHWPVLFGHLVMFRYIYPDQHEQIPEWVTRELAARFAQQRPESAHVCRGTLLSREQYLWDLDELHYEDARLRPRGGMSRSEIQIWTAAIGKPEPR